MAEKTRGEAVDKLFTRLLPEPDVPGKITQIIPGSPALTADGGVECMLFALTESGEVWRRDLLSEAVWRDKHDDDYPRGYWTCIKPPTEDDRRNIE